MIIRVENTAISNGVSKSAIELERLLDTNDHGLDFGAGKLRNSYYLQSKGIDVSIVDTPLQIERINFKGYKTAIFKDVFDGMSLLPNETYNKVLCSFVLNVIPEQKEREEVIGVIYRTLMDGGWLFLEVRRSHGIMKNKHMEKWKDGYLVGEGNIRTFQKPFEEKEVIEIVSKAGFRIEAIRNFSDSYVAIARKK